MSSEISKTPITSDKARAAFDLERLLASLDAAGEKGGKAAEAPAVAQSLNRVLETLNNKAETPSAPPTSFSSALTAVAEDINKATQQKSALDANDPLLTRPDVVATPHLAGASRQVATESARRVSEEVARYLATGELEHCANPGWSGERS